MGVIAWIVLGLGAGLLIPGRRSQGLILTCVIGIAGRSRSRRADLRRALRRRTVAQR